MQLDLLAFGPHPDDIEIGLGGTVAKHVARGHRVGLCDLTKGELGSNGTPEQRLREAEAARQVLGADWRENLEWVDGAIHPTDEYIRQAVEMIRRWRPRTIALPYWQDRHPDHTAASEVLTTAAFKSGLRRYQADGEAWQAEWICYYFINHTATASFVIDVSHYYDVKRRALACHASQFDAGSAGAVATRLTSARFMQLIESRDRHFGAQVGVAYAEAVLVREPILRPHLLKNADMANEE